MDSHLRRRLLLTSAGTLLLAAIVSPVLLRAQSSDSSSWEEAAGGKMSFDVVSVKRSDSASFHANIPLTLGASNFASVGNLMSVDVPLRALIGFAFKLSAGQMHYFISGLPPWVDSDWFDVEGRAAIAAPSKDQFRLMVQSLLADRFKMVAHTENRPLPFYALVLTKAGKAGPQLIQHVDNAECGAEGKPNAPPAPPEFVALPCNATLMRGSDNPGHVHGGGLNVSLDYIAAFLTGTGFQGTESDRPVVNQTGLAGNYDFWIEFAPQAGALPGGAPPDPNGPTFPEALQDQLGLKLVAKTGPLNVVVIDHIEEPAPN